MPPVDFLGSHVLISSVHYHDHHQTATLLALLADQMPDVSVTCQAAELLLPNKNKQSRQRFSNLSCLLAVLDYHMKVLGLHYAGLALEGALDKVACEEDARIASRAPRVGGMQRSAPFGGAKRRRVSALNTSESSSTSWCAHL